MGIGEGVWLPATFLAVFARQEDSQTKRQPGEGVAKKLFENTMRTRVKKELHTISDMAIMIEKR